MTADVFSAIYDFEFMPYALGDVLTWNVNSAICCEQLGRKQVDTFICLDERSPSSIYQRDFATAKNSGLLFNELLGAFGTHPMPGNLLFFRRREQMLQRLRELALRDGAISRFVDEYEQTVAARDKEEVLVRYFTRNAHSHDGINAFFAQRGSIPRLRPSSGCEPDVQGLITKRFGGRRIVAIHMRHRRVDVGYGGEFSYHRDSDFLEWHEFLCEAASSYPDVQFVALGRLQEKPLDLFNLPNVACLRTWGLGLGHELTLMRRSDLFIGASSGFAAMAYFSEVPYFITRMTREACKAYTLEFGTERFPFGSERQVLVYEPETKELLMRLLERGLANVPPRGGVSGPAVDPVIDIRSWEWERSRWLQRGATTYRFFNDAAFTDKETAFLMWPRLKQARADWRRGSWDSAWTVLDRIEASFPRMCEKFPEFLRLRMTLAAARNDARVVECCKANLTRIAAQRKRGLAGWLKESTRCLARGYPAAMRMKYLWSRKHRIPRKLADLIRNLALRRTRPDPRGAG